VRCGDDVSVHGIARIEKAPPVLDRAAITALLAACAGRSLDDRRDNAIITLLADTGIRRGELAGLLVEDIDLERTVAIVSADFSKSRRARSVPFGTRGGTALVLAGHLRRRPTI
jgi:integrase/recombinase XerC